MNQFFIEILIVVILYNGNFIYDNNYRFICSIKLTFENVQEYLEERTNTIATIVC